VVSGAVSIILVNNRKLDESNIDYVDNRPLEPRMPLISVKIAVGEPFLRIPPFPGAKPQYFAPMFSAEVSSDNIIAAVRQARVGGTYWAAQPALPPKYTLVTSAFAVEPSKEITAKHPIVLWDRNGDGGASSAYLVVTGECDPWHMLQNASALVGESGDDLRIIAALLGIPSFDTEKACGKLLAADVDPAQLLTEQFAETVFENPFTGEPMGVLEAIALSGFWRRLIDSNRDIVAGAGFAFWKQDHVAPLLWNGSSPFEFVRGAAHVEKGSSIAVWRSKVSSELAVELERAGARLIEVEDGFLRSRGLGADCVPPLSITVDRLGAYFDPQQASELENLLQDGEFDDALLSRARELRRLIVDAGLGKYGRGGDVLDRPAGDRRHILVPGQVEDDRAVTAGGCGLVSNLELLKRVRRAAPDAYILYKPHPDVVAGHRRGQISSRSCLEFADEIVGDLPISSLIAMVNEVHVNTSLAGFEALLREKPVTTYGLPFYAGWGLTNDQGPVPSRRARRLSLDELVAGVLLLYPRYLDPVSGLPCPAEIVVARLTRGEEPDPGPVVTMRRLQGKIMRRLRSLLQ